MAKELPYFKFEPSEWENGNIQLCTFEEKGVFIEICSMYWIRLGDLSYALALQKVCNGNALALDSIINKEIIIVENDKLTIDFLDEQLAGFKEKSDQMSQAANKRWSKNAYALPMQSKSNAIREEKIREEKIIIPSVFEFIEYCKSKQPNIDESHAKLKFDQWVENGWKDGYNKPIKMWKSKANGVIPHLKTIEVKAEPKYKLDRSTSHHF